MEEFQEKEAEKMNVGEMKEGKFSESKMSSD